MYYSEGNNVTRAISNCADTKDRLWIFKYKNLYYEEPKENQRIESTVNLQRRQRVGGIPIRVRLLEDFDHALRNL